MVGGGGVGGRGEGAHTHTYISGGIDSSLADKVHDLEIFCGNGDGGRGVAAFVPLDPNASG